MATPWRYGRKLLFVLISQMIEADGTPLSPLSVHTFPIHVAQRYSFILETNQSATSYWIRAVMNTNCFNDMNDQLDPMVLAILQYNTPSISVPNTTAWDNTMDVICRDLNLTELVPLNPEPLPESDLQVRIDTSFQTRAADLNFAFVNSTSWIPLNGTNILQKVAFTDGNYSVQGVDSADFPIASQFVYSIPDIKTVEYFPSWLV
jgi:Multicopper oxidase